MAAMAYILVNMNCLIYDEQTALHACVVWFLNHGTVWEPFEFSFLICSGLVEIKHQFVTTKIIAGMISTVNFATQTYMKFIKPEILTTS